MYTMILPAAFQFHRRAFLIAFFLYCIPSIPAQESLPTFFTKLFPPETEIFFSGTRIEPLAVNGTYRAYSLPPGTHHIVLTARGYLPRAVEMHVADGMLLEEKLERRESGLRLLGEFSTGRQPKSVEFSPDGRYLVVPLLGDKGIGLYETRPFRSIGTIEIPEEYAVEMGFVESAFIESVGELWVSQMATGMVHVIDMNGWEWKAAYRTGGAWPKVLAPSPDGLFCCVSNWLSGSVSFLETATGRIRAVVPTGGTPRGMVFSADGGFLYVCLFDSGDVAVIDCREFRVVRTLHLGPGAARHILRSGDSDTLYMTDMYNGTVSVVSPDGIVLRRCYVGPNPNTLKISPDGRLLFVSIRGRNDSVTYLREGPEFGRIMVLDAATLDLVDWVWGRNQPTGLAVSPDGMTLVFSDFLNESVEVYRIGIEGYGMIGNDRNRLR